MIPLPKLKKDMEFMRDMEGIVDIFKTAALIQFRLFQSKKKANAAFLKNLQACWPLMGGRRFKSPYVVSTAEESEGDWDIRSEKAIVMITTDEGFLGGLNTLIMDAGMQRRTSPDDEIIVLGERGAYYLQARKMRFVSLPGIDEDVSPGRIEKVCSHVLKGYYKRFKQVFVVYPEFVSLSTQRVATVSLLPYVIPKISRQDTARLRRYKDIIIEPAERNITKVFVELWTGYKFLEIFLSAKQAEYAARIMHLEGSLQEISGLKEKLIVAYFRQVHALQDKMIREISASKILLGSRRR